VLCIGDKGVETVAKYPSNTARPGEKQRKGLKYGRSTCRLYVKDNER
jgi:hypothetical protein